MPVTNPTTFGTAFKYGIKGSQLTGLIVETFDNDAENRIRVELLNELGQLVGLRLDDTVEKLSVSAVVTGTPPVVGEVITFAPEDGASSATGVKYIVLKVVKSGSASDKMKVKIDAEKYANITIA